MNAAQLQRLGDLMALARQASELRLAGLRARIGQAQARRFELQLMLSAPMHSGTLSDRGAMIAELDWRRSLTARISAQDHLIAELTDAADAARLELQHAFGRERAVHRVAEGASEAEARQSGRRAEDMALPHRRGST